MKAASATRIIRGWAAASKGGRPVISCGSVPLEFRPPPRYPRRGAPGRQMAKADLLSKPDPYVVVHTLPTGARTRPSPKGSALGSAAARLIHRGERLRLVST